MERGLIAAVIAGALLAGGGARAQVGSKTVAIFEHPAPPAMTWTPEDADAAYTIVWREGSLQPVGAVSVYFLDHPLPDAALPNDVKTLGDNVITTAGTAALNVTLACEATDGGSECRHRLDWRTADVPEGSYWLAIQSSGGRFDFSEAPVRIAHGGAQPRAAAVFVQPGPGAMAESSYTLRAFVAGVPPVTGSLSWGIDVNPAYLDNVTPIVKDLPLVPDASGAVEYTWDVSALPRQRTFVRLVMKDGLGRYTFTDSQYGLALTGTQVGADAGLDAGAPPHTGCDVAPGDSGATACGAAGLAAGLLAIAVAWRRARRRASRG